MRLSVAGDTNMGSGAWDGRLRGELTEFIGRRAVAPGRLSWRVLQRRECV